MANAEIQRITSDAAPRPAGHYSQACCTGDLIFVSGQLPIGPDGNALDEKSFADQARQAIANMLAIVKAAGSGPDRVLKVTAFIVGIENWPAFNAIYAELFGASKPARSVVPVPALHNGLLVEIEAIASR
jgi:2-iminobutanoate/2-iminopropanoate deaminase